MRTQVTADKLSLEVQNALHILETRFKKFAAMANEVIDDTPIRSNIVGPWIVQEPTQEYVGNDPVQMHKVSAAWGYPLFGAEEFFPDLLDALQMYQSARSADASGRHSVYYYCDITHDKGVIQHNKGGYNALTVSLVDERRDERYQRIAYSSYLGLESQREGILSSMGWIRLAEVFQRVRHQVMMDVRLLKYRQQGKL